MKHLSILLCLVLLTAAQVCHADGEYKVGDRVASPAGYADKWLQSVVVEVDPSKPYPYRVHPLGYLDTMDESFNAKMLKPMGSITTQPIGGIANDSWLLKVKGMKPFHPKEILKGEYECWNGLHADMMLNFRILDNHRFHDASGTGTYHFDPNSMRVSFKGSGLNGEEGVYEQALAKPDRRQPPTVTLREGQTCQLKM